jgi:hypothetical protein
VNWTVVRTPEELAVYPFKTNWAAHVITEHFAVRPQQRLLVVYGDGHIHHNGGTLMSDVEAKLDRTQLFAIGTLRDLGNGDAERVATFGDSTRAFFIAAPGFPSTQSLPRDLFYAAAGPLSTYVDALVYLGPDADRDLSNSIELTGAQRAEIARREAIASDSGRLLQLRLGNRKVWFQTHPNDIPERP